MTQVYTLNEIADKVDELFTENNLTTKERLQVAQILISNYGEKW